MRHLIRTPVALALPLFVAMSCNGLVGNDPVYLVGGSAGDWSDAGAGAAPDESGGRTSSGGASTGGRNAAGAGGEAGQGGAASCGECVPGTSQEPTQRCGLCNAGTQKRRRTCSSDCTWGPFSEWSTCVEGTVECMPNEKQGGQQDCGTGCSKGKQTRSRTCTAQCTWGAWSAWSACNIDVECQPNHYDCCGSNHWHWCLPSTCTWSTDCTPCTAPNCDCP